MKLKKNEGQSVDTLPLHIHGRSYRDKVWSCDERMDHLETAISGDLPHNQRQNAESCLCIQLMSFNWGIESVDVERY